MVHGRLLWVALAAAACGGNEYGISRQLRVDVFEQDRLAAIDLLLVVDNSQSMVEEQGNLAAAFDRLIAALQAGNTDWRVAVTTTETSYDAWRGALEGGLDELLLTNAAGDLIDEVAWDDRSWGVEAGQSYARCGDGWRAAEPSRGAWNPCDDEPAVGVDDGPRAPAPGELALLELQPLRDGCGWVELANRSASTLSLAGLTLGDGQREAAALPDRLLAPGETLTWTAFDGCDGADWVDDGVHLATGERWVDPDTADGARTFAELVSVGDDSFGLEMGFENALLVLQEPVYPAFDGDFLRGDADLAVVFVSDEDDLSPDPVDDTINAFRALKGVPGQREPERVRLAVVAGIDPPTAGGATSCSSALGDAAFAPRYQALAERSGGPSWSICGDISGIAEEIGLTVSTQTLEFQLSSLPALDTLTLRLFTSSEADEALPTPVRDVDYTLFTTDDDDGTQRAWMRFADGALPPGSSLVVEYQTLPDTARLELTPVPL
jgi:hypothetical protein